MPCPFMTRLSPSYIRNYGSNLLKTYGQHCPFMSRLTGTLTSASSSDEGKDKPHKFCVIIKYLYFNFSGK
jgi:hypothetical protein